MKRGKWIIAGCVLFMLGVGAGLFAANRLGKQENGQQDIAEGETAAVMEMQEIGEEDSIDFAEKENIEESGEISEKETPDMAPEEIQPRTVKVLNPSWDYYAETAGKAETKPLEITVLEQKENGITDEESWFSKNGLELRELNDEDYFCSIDKDNMTVAVWKNGDMEITLDFSDYQYADDFRPEDKDFVEQEIRSAAVYEGILYVSVFHYTYAESSPHNGYIAAISPEDGQVLWKTEPLTCNSLNFEILGDVICCGYGFTAEDDYLYQLDRHTGKRIGQIPLVSKADYIIFKDDRLFVRTYNTDYVFQVSGLDN